MTSPRRFEQDLPAILADLYLAGTPDYRDDLVRQVDRVKQRPAWTFLERWIPVDIATRPLASGSTRLPGRQLLVLAVLAALITAALAVYVGSRPRLPEPFGLAANGLIVYAQGGDIYARDSIESSPRLLVGGPDNEQVWWFSRQGATMLFTRVGAGTAPTTVWIARPDGSDQRRLDGEYRQLSSIDWSPQGDLLAIAHRHKGRDVVTLAPTDGSPATRLDLDMEATQPAWRPPDGGQLSFRGKDADGWGQFIVERDGSGLRRLALTTERMFETEFDVRDAKWSSDGRRLLYDSIHDVTAGNGSGLRIHVAEIGADGAVLSDTRYDFETTADDELNAAWLPGEDRIVYQRRLGNDEVPIVDTLRVGTLGPGAPSADLGVKSTTGEGIGYEVSPDGKSVLSVAWAEATAYLTDLTTLTSVQVPFTTDQGATWQRVAVP